MEVSNYIPLLPLTITGVSFTFSDLLKAAGFLISGGLLTFIGVILTNKKDLDINKREIRSESEKVFMEYSTELLEDYRTFKKEMIEDIKALKNEVKLKDEEIERKNQLIVDLKNKAEQLADEVSKLMEQNAVLIQQNKDLSDKNDQLMKQNRLLIDKLESINGATNDSTNEIN